MAHIRPRRAFGAPLALASCLLLGSSLLLPAALPPAQAATAENNDSDLTALLRPVVELSGGSSTKDPLPQAPEFDATKQSTSEAMGYPAAIIGLVVVGNFAIQYLPGLLTLFPPELQNLLAPQSSQLATIPAVTSSSLSADSLPTSNFSTGSLPAGSSPTSSN